MIDDRKRRGEWAALLDAWTAPAPPRGFSDRVLAACAPPSALAPRLSIVREPPPRSRRGGILVAAALAAAALIFVPLALRHRDGSSTPSAPAMVTVGDSADLGSIHD
ncbi:MAG TPA: hypothetical protein VGL86_21705 [Polyangia bacterium]|jgi:hypothetical protein